jgi:hypothetical protein
MTRKIVLKSTIVHLKDKELFALVKDVSGTIIALHTFNFKNRNGRTHDFHKRF